MVSPIHPELRSLATSLNIDAEAVQGAIKRLAESRSPEPDDPEQAILDVLVNQHKIRREVASVRLKEFCDQHPRLSLALIYQCLGDRRIRVKFGRMVPGTNFPKAQNHRRGLHDQ